MKNIAFFIGLLFLSIFQNSYGMIAQCIVLNKHPLAEIHKLIAQGHDVNALYPQKEYKSSTYGGCTPLEIACKKGDVGLVKLFLSMPKAKIHDSFFLHSVIPQCKNQNHHDIACLLVADHRINVNTQNKDGDSALHIASFCNSTQIATALLKRKDIDPTIKNSDHKSPMLIACTKGHADIITVLLNYDPALIHEKNRYGSDLFQITLINNRKKAATALLKHPGVDVFTRDSDSNTPLHWACSYDNEEVIDFILNQYQEENQMEEINAQNEQGNTPLHACMKSRDGRSCRQLNNSCIKKLLDAGAKTLIRNGKQNTPLELCYFPIRDNMGNVIALDEENLQRMIKSTDENGNNHLHLHAAKKIVSFESDPFERTISSDESVSYIDFLVSQGLSVWKRNKEGKNAQDIARERCALQEMVFKASVPDNLPAIMDSLTERELTLTYIMNCMRMNSHREKIMHSILRHTCADISCAVFKKIIGELLPELQGYIMFYYYILNIETIIARKFNNSDNYSHGSISTKNTIKRLLIHAREPHLLWGDKKV